MTKFLSEVGIVPYNSQYPLTSCDRTSNKIYYSASALNGRRMNTGNQLYSLDLSTGETKKLTIVNYNPDTSRLIALAYSSSEDQYRISHQDRIPYVSPDITIYSMNINTRAHEKLLPYKAKVQSFVLMSLPLLSRMMGLSLILKSKSKMDALLIPSVEYIVLLGNKVVYINLTECVKLTL